MKMNNKYLSGLLAGVLTAGVLQGSGGKENMPGLGGQQIPVVRAQTADELPAELQELFLAFSQSLAERGYRAQIDLSSIQMPMQITRINTLSENNGIQSSEDTFGPSEMSLSEHEIPSAPAELTHLTIGENGEIKEGTSDKKSPAAKQTKLDPFHMQIVQQYMGHTKNENGKSATHKDLENLIQVSKNFSDQPERNRINTVPITKDHKGLFPQLNTQQIFGHKKEIILEGMYQYIITYPVTKEEIETWVKELQDKHTGKALKDGKKPIVFEYQLLPDFWPRTHNHNSEIMTESPNDLFEIKKYYIDTYTSQWDLEYYNRNHFLRNLGKPIIFKEIDTIRVNRHDVYLKDILDGAKAQLYKIDGNANYENYCELIQKYPAISNGNLVFPRVVITGQSREEQLRQMKVLSMDKRVFSFALEYQTPDLMGIVTLGNVKCGEYYSITINPNDLQKQKIVAFCEFELSTSTQLENRKIYSFYNFKRQDDAISEAVKKYVQYVNDNNLGYLSGFVNFANKPSYLTDEEWRKVIVLTGMVEELMDLVDQKFNEYEANPNAALANDPYVCVNIYGCGGHGNPYGQYYYAN